MAVVENGFVDSFLLNWKIEKKKCWEILGKKNYIGNRKYILHGVESLKTTLNRFWDTTQMSLHVKRYQPLQGAGHLSGAPKNEPRHAMDVTGQQSPPPTQAHRWHKSP